MPLPLFREWIERQSVRKHRVPPDRIRGGFDDLVLAGEVLWAVTRATLYGGCFFLVVLLMGLAPLPGSLWALPLLPSTRVNQRAIRE